MKSAIVSIFILSLVSSAFLSKGQNKLIGMIANVMDSTAIADANIFLPDINSQSQSDDKGNFKFANLPKGYLKVHVSKAGFSNYSDAVLINDSVTILKIGLVPTSNTLDEIVIYGEQQSKKSQTSNNIDVLDSKTMRENGAISLSDGIAKLPGVNQLSTGAGISKPVIRGLFGNRIQTILLGMRFDNQQWQDEHGLGLSDIGVDRIEIIKGPATLLYGSEAMGGVLNIITEKTAPVGKIQSDVSTRFFSNTYGYAVDVGVKKSSAKINWGIRLGSESHADYSDGNNQRILNSRFGGYVGKAFFGFKHKNWVSENNYLFALNNFGFLMDAYQLYDKPDDRLSRSFERPHHTVVLNLCSSQNTLFLKSSKLKINLGAHVNNRQEQEGAGGISLDMLLKTYTALFIWVKNFNETTELSFGSQNQFQTNLNQGSRIIVPDAHLAETSVFGYLKKQQKYYVVEGGLRYDLKTIQTFATGVLNNGNPFNPGTNIVPVNNAYNTLNGSLGISLFDSKHIHFKINTSSGYRGPNLAELSSNGLHEGSLRYELGNVNLKIEQNFCADVYADYHNKWLTAFATIYENRFLNYIYLQPSNADYLGFRIYNYIQKNANIKGFEGGLSVHPAALKFIEVKTNYSIIVGQTDNHEYLPFIPAQKINTELKFKTTQLSKLKNAFLLIGCANVLAQNTPNQFETSTTSYNLINAGIGSEFYAKKNKLSLSISGTNLLNENYYDHLSRFKYFGIYNIGRSINLNLKFQFN